MGIKGLKTNMKKHNINTKCFPLMPLNIFQGKILAIDLYNWLFTYLNIIYKNIVNNKPDIFEEVNQDIVLMEMYESWIKFNRKLFKQHIIPLWIKDGKSKKNKAVTQKERRKTREDNMQKRDNMKNQLKLLNPLEITRELENEYRKLEARCAYISYEHREKFFSFIFNSGIPAIEAADEAENLACSLYVERKVHFIWSADTDCCPLEGDFIVKKMKYVNNRPHFETIITSIMRKELGLNIKQFRDFCIILGTDFNNNPQSIGWVNALKLIKKYGSLEEMEKNTQHLDFIHYKGIREQLTPYKTNISLDRLLINKEVNYKDLIKFTNSPNLLSFITEMCELNEPHMKYINYYNLEYIKIKNEESNESKIEDITGK